MERSEPEAGKTDSSAPESIRKKRLVDTSKIDIEEEEDEAERGAPAAAINDRPLRFPTSSVLDGAWDSA